MTTEDLRTSGIGIKAAEACELAPHENCVAPAVAPRKMNRVSSMSFPNGVGVPMTVGQRLTVRRLELGLTQEQVASRVMFRPKSGKRENHDCPLSRTAYCMYERDMVPLSLKSVEDVAKALDISPAWLAFGIGEPKTKKAKGARLKAGISFARRTKVGPNNRFTASGV